MNRPFTIALTSFLLALVALFTYHSLIANEYARLTFLSWKDDGQDLTIKRIETGVLSKPEVVQLRQLITSETLQVEGAADIGYQPGATLTTRIVIVMKQPVITPVDLPVPDHRNLIYLQGNTGWQKFPDDAPMTHRVIRLGPHENYPGQTMYWFQREDGAQNWGTAISW